MNGKVNSYEIRSNEIFVYTNIVYDVNELSRFYFRSKIVLTNVVQKNMAQLVQNYYHDAEKKNIVNTAFGI